MLNKKIKKRLNVDNKTIIILTADYGEDLAERDISHAFRHAGVYYDTVLRVPLILEGNEEYLSPYVFSENCVIRTEEWKFIEGDKGPELYNLKKDPQELDNLIDIEKEKFIFLKEKLENWRKQARPKGETKPQPLTEEQKQRLRSLGYLQ